MTEFMKTKSSLIIGVFSPGELKAGKKWLEEAAERYQGIREKGEPIVLPAASSFSIPISSKLIDLPPSILNVKTVRSECSDMHVVRSYLIQHRPLGSLSRSQTDINTISSLHATSHVSDGWSF